MAVQWREDLAVGVEKIDNQHKELFNRTNQLLNACNVGKGKGEVVKLIEFLEEYVVRHFADEEEFQKKYGYPGYEKHKEQHVQFMQQVNSLKTKFTQEGSSLTLIVEINRKVIDWLVNHIGKVDKELAVFLKANNVR